MNGVCRGGGAGGRGEHDVTPVLGRSPSSGAEGTAHTKISSRALGACLTGRHPTQAQRHRQAGGGPDGLAPMAPRRSAWEGTHEGYDGLSKRPVQGPAAPGSGRAGPGLYPERVRPR